MNTPAHQQCKRWWLYASLKVAKSKTMIRENTASACSLLRSSCLGFIDMPAELVNVPGPKQPDLSMP